MKKLVSILMLMALILIFTQCKKDCIKSERCKLEPDAGPCMSYMPQYYYDKNEKKCKEFIYGGCDGLIPFATLAECEKQCSCK